MSEPEQYRYEAVVKIEMNSVRYASSKEHFIEQVIADYANDNFYVCRDDFSDIDTDNPNEED